MVSLFVYADTLGRRGVGVLDSENAPLTLLVIGDRNEEGKVLVCASYKPQVTTGDLFSSENSDILPRNPHLNVKEGGKYELVPKKTFNEICRESKNIFVKELMAARSATVMGSTRGQENPLGIVLLLNYFSQHLDELATLDGQTLFHFTLFSALKLPIALRTIPNSEKTLKDFFDESLLYFDERIDLEDSTKAIVFLLSEWQRVLLYMQHENRDVDSLLREVKSKLKECLAHERYTNKQKIHLALIESVENKHVTKESIKDLLIQIAGFVMEQAIDDEIPPILVAKVYTVLVKHLNRIRDLMNDSSFRNETLSDIAKLNGGVKFEKSAWVEKGFPLYAYNEYEINILSGEFKKSGEKPSILTKEMIQSPSYQQLFGSKKLLVFMGREGLEASDAIGPILIKVAGNSISEIKRQFDGEWYTFSLKLKIPFSVKEKLSIFESPNKKQLGIDTVKNIPFLLIDEEGKITFLQETDKKLWTWQKPINQKQSMASMDEECYLLFSDDGTAVRFNFPHLGLELFQVANGPWRVKSTPHLKVSGDQTFPGIRDFEQFVVLETDSKEKEVWIPIKTKNEVKAPDTPLMILKMKEDKVVSSSSYPYLAYLYLSHARTPEDYGTAMDSLQKAYKYERYTQEELQLLGWIFFYEDQTPHATALKLYTAWLVYDNLKRNPEDPIKAPEEIVDLSLRSPPLEWQLFWEGNHPKTELADMLYHNVARRYAALQSKLPFGLKIDNILTEQEFIDWRLERYLMDPGSKIKEEKPLSKISNETIEFLKNMKKSTSSSILIPGRPGIELKNSFYYLWNAQKTLNEDTLQ